MAASGSFSNYPATGFGLYCTWTAEQSVTNNYSDVTLNVYLKYYNIYVSTRTDSTVSIGGVTETYTTPAISEDSKTSHTTLLKSKTVRIGHNSDGTKTGIVLSASWRFGGVYSGVTVGTITASATIDLDALDRSAPSVSCSISAITAKGFRIFASTSATADIWQYSINGGASYTQFSTTAGTSASITLSSLTPNTSYLVKAQARKKSNQVYGTSGTTSIKTLGGAVINSCDTITADASTVTVSTIVTVYNVSYSHYISICNGDTEYLALGARTWTAGTATQTLTLTSTERTTLLNAMSGIKSFTATIKLVTKEGSTQIGNASSYLCTVQTTEANSAPTMAAFTYYDGNTATSAITGNNQLFIQTYSHLYLTPGAATAKNGASIVKYAATCNGTTYSNTNGAVINLYGIAKSGTLDVIVTATDSRGYTVSRTQQITVIPYSKPKVSSISLRRTNDIAAEMQLVFNGSISPVTVNSVQKNSLKYVQYRYKLTSTSSYGAYSNILTSVTQNGTGFSFSNLQLCSLDANSSYDFHLYIRDQLDTLSELNLYFVVPQGTPLISLRKKKVGINTSNPNAALHVVGNTALEGEVAISGAVTAGSVSATTLSGSLSPTNLSSAVPIAKGGTGATTAAEAAANIVAAQSISPASVAVGSNRYYTGGSFGINMAKSDIIGINGLWFGDTVDVAGEGINFYRSSTSWDRLYSYAGTLYYAPNVATATHPGTRYSVYHSGGETIPITKGGTGGITAAAARSNLGIACTSLYSGSLSSGSTTFNYGNYKAYIIVGNPSTNSDKMSIIIPQAILTTTDVGYQIADETYYRIIKLKYSGSTVTLTIGNGNGYITNVYGIN